MKPLVTSTVNTIAFAMSMWQFCEETTNKLACPMPGEGMVGCEGDMLTVSLCQGLISLFYVLCVCLWHVVFWKGLVSLFYVLSLWHVIRSVLNAFAFDKTSSGKTNLEQGYKSSAKDPSLWFTCLAFNLTSHFLKRIHLERTHLSVLHTAPLTCHFLERMGWNKNKNIYFAKSWNWLFMVSFPNKCFKTFQWKIYRRAEFFWGVFYQRVLPHRERETTITHKGEVPKHHMVEKSHNRGEVPKHHILEKSHNWGEVP